MGNQITNSAKNLAVNFSNSVTDSLYRGILIEGSRIAKSLWEKRLMLFIAGKNQNVIGPGIVGFDITELEWDKSELNSQKRFLLKIVRDSRLNKSYNKYGFNLKEEIGDKFLLEIEDLILGLEAGEIKDSKLKFYVEPLNKSFEKCIKHDVFLNNFQEGEKQRCLICCAL